MVATTFIKYVCLTAALLYFLRAAASSSSSDLKSHKDLIDYLYRKGYIKSSIVKEKMSLVDRRFFVVGKPYEDSSQPGERGTDVPAPHMHALALEGLKDHLTVNAKVSCILCDTGYLLACMGLFVSTNGAVIGVQVKYLVTLLDYDHLGSWATGTSSVKQLGFKKNLPFLLYTRDDTTNYVPGDELSAIYYRGADQSTIEVLGRRLKIGGRLIYEKPKGSGDPELMIIDKLSDGSLYETPLIDPTMESNKEREGEDLLPPVISEFPDSDELLITSSQIKHIPDIKVLLPLVCIGIVSCSLLF